MIAQTSMIYATRSMRNPRCRYKKKNGRRCQLALHKIRECIGIYPGINLHVWECPLEHYQLYEPETVGERFRESLKDRSPRVNKNPMSPWRRNRTVVRRSE